MVRITIKVQDNAMPNFTESIPEIQKKGLQYTAQGLIRQLMQNSPVDTGLLRQWAVTEHTEEEYHIQSPAQYVKYVNEGTGIYGPYKTPIINPAIGKKFAFEVNGQMIYTNIIKGQKGQHFVEKSISQTQDKLAGFFIKAIREVLE